MAHDKQQQSITELGPLEIYRQSAEKSLLALDAIAKLTRQFADKPDFQQLVQTILFTLSGQFSLPDSFSILRKPGAPDQKVAFTATGKFSTNMLLKSLMLTPELGWYFLQHSSPNLVSESDLQDACASHVAILRDCGVEVVCPLIHSDKLLGIIGLGKRVTKRPFAPEDIQLLDTLVSTITPLVVSAYHFHEMTSLSVWYLDILDNVKQGVFVFDVKNRLRKVNAVGFNILTRFDRKLDDVVALQGMLMDEVFSPAVFVDWARRFAKANVENRDKTIEGLIANAEDVEYVYEAYLTGISGDSESETDLIITLDDITERKRAEEALKKSEERFRRQFEGALDAIFIADAKTGIIIDCNLAGSELVGREKTELVGKHQNILHPPDEIKGEFSRTFREHLGQKEGQALETQIITKRGEIRDVAIKANLLEIEGKKVLQGVFRDVTERKQAEKQEQELRDKLERAERMESLGILAGGVAHDLNNTLGPLVGYPELILMELPENSPLREQVQRIGKTAQDAADVAQDLLTLARRGRYEMVPTDVNEILQAYIDSPSFVRLTEKHLDVTVKLKLDRSIDKILGSAPHLSKVFMNLIVNAFDAMPEGGELTIETSQQYLESLESGYDKVEPHDYARFRVRDTGMGIDPKDLDKIFEPYYSKKKMGTSGSGLGLSVVYGIVKDHKGYYDILSTVGVGTEFILYFPVTSMEVELGPDTEANYSGKEKVLVVDDVEDQRILASDLLSSLGYRVETASNGREAVEYLRNHSVDIIVLDMIMEKDFDGLDTYREIIRLHPGQKAVIVSGFSVTKRVEKMQKLGAGPYIRKPYTREVIGKAVREELDKEPIATRS